MCSALSDLVSVSGEVASVWVALRWQRKCRVVLRGAVLAGDCTLVKLHAGYRASAGHRNNGTPKEGARGSADAKLLAIRRVAMALCILSFQPQNKSRMERQKKKVR